MDDPEEVPDLDSLPPEVRAAAIDRAINVKAKLMAQTPKGI